MLSANTQRVAQGKEGEKKKPRSKGDSNRLYTEQLILEYGDGWMVNGEIEEESEKEGRGEKKDL